MSDVPTMQEILESLIIRTPDGLSAEELAQELQRATLAIRALLRSMVPDKLPVDDSWQDDVDMRPLLQRRNGYNHAIDKMTRRMGELK